MAPSLNRLSSIVLSAALVVLSCGFDAQQAAAQTLTGRVAPVSSTPQLGLGRIQQPSLLNLSSIVPPVFLPTASSLSAPSAPAASALAAGPIVKPLNPAAVIAAKIMAAAPALTPALVAPSAWRGGSRQEPLDALLDDVADSPGAIVVFDLDDTLFSTAERNLRIIAEYAALIETQDARSARLLRRVTRSMLRYSIADTAKDAGLSQRLAKDLYDFWSARFYTNPYLLEDSVIPGGPEYAAEVIKRRGRVFYLTGRNESMREGTEAKLLRHGFPKPDGQGATLMLKPSFDTPDLAFKNEALGKIAEMGTVAGSFENEPANVNLFVERFPKGRHFLLETKHSGDPMEPHASVLRIANFRRDAGLTTIGMIGHARRSVLSNPNESYAQALKKAVEIAVERVGVSLGVQEEPVAGDKDAWYRFYDDKGNVGAVNGRTFEVRVVKTAAKTASPAPGLMLE